MPAVSRRDLFGLMGGGALAHASARRQQPLNFVLILIDDMGWTDLACYGSRFHETPHIDRLAAQGVRFTNAYAAAPLCSATRASVLTGRYPARLNLTTALPGTAPPRPSERFLSPVMPPGLPLSEVTIAEALKPAGYATASIGKWHLGAENYYPEKQGFDVNIGGTATGMAPGLFYPTWKGTARGIPIEGRPGEYLTDRLNAEALSFIEANKDRPFFLYLSHYAVHTFIQAKEELIEKYRRKLNPKDPHHHPVYAAMIESVDEGVGRLTRKLDELGIADRTVILFTSDNGGVINVQTYTPDPLPPTSNVPLRSGKATLYEGGIRVPLIVRGPGVRAGAVCDVPAFSGDLLPTILDKAGLKPDPKAAIDGVSLAPVLQRAGKLQREAIYWHFPHYTHVSGPGAASAVRAGDYKLLEFIDEGTVELYNLKDDIGERNNLAPSMPKKARELRSMLRRWKESIGAQTMAPNPGHKPPGRVLVVAHPWVYAATQPSNDITPILDQIFADLKYAGFDGIELMHTALRPADSVERIGEISRRHGLTVIGSSYDARMWDRAQHAAILEDATVVIGRLARLGGRTLGTSVGFKKEKKTEEELDAQADLLKQIMEICRKNRVVLNLHNHVYEVRDNEHDLSGTLKRIPEAKVGPDIGWLVRAKVDPVDFIRRHGKRLVFAHLRDEKADGTWPEAMGEGVIDYAAVGKALRETGFDGDLAIELAHEKGFKLTRPLRESLRISREHVRKVMGY